MSLRFVWCSGSLLAHATPLSVAAVHYFPDEGLADSPPSDTQWIFEGEAYLGEILCVSLPFVSKPFLCVTHPRAIENEKYFMYFAIA